MPLKKWIAKGFIAIILAVGGACLEASSDIIKNNFEPVLVSARNFLEDRLSPIPSSALIGINLTFYLSSADAGEAYAEGVSATIPGSLCLASNGHNIVRPFEESANGYKTNVIMHIACRPSGRISITLSPQNGQGFKVYEGRLSDGDKVAFSGVPGSYNAGIVTIYRLDAIEPQGPWVPANKCLRSNTCEDSDFSISE
ncbi:hypothetical protein [Pantoea rodasii]|uniref:hypothetical protein n=1 Tax=Pantoea rodasii TaxID=1076549 RepID=UPI000FFB3F02|nr:hypothetical protein [Pantoea rodasii]